MNYPITDASWTLTCHPVCWNGTRYYLRHSTATHTNRISSSSYITNFGSKQYQDGLLTIIHTIIALSNQHLNKSNKIFEKRADEEVRKDEEEVEQFTVYASVEDDDTYKQLSTDIILHYVTVNFLKNNNIFILKL